MFTMGFPIKPPLLFEFDDDYASISNALVCVGSDNSELVHISSPAEQLMIV
jgi:hypothetical protein